MSRTSTAPSGPPKPWVNLERAVVLLIDNSLGTNILSHIFYGFGARTLHLAKTGAEAREMVATKQLDLIIIEALLEDEDGTDFVAWLRRRPDGDVNRFAPVIVLSAHTAADKVVKSRDCGANFFVAKPVSPRIVMDRLLWVAREKRQFLQSDSYAGPDRRFQENGPPPGVLGRRRDDPTDLPDILADTPEPVEAAQATALKEASA